MDIVNPEPSDKKEKKPKAKKVEKAYFSTRIVESRRLTASKLKALKETAEDLGKLRKEAWERHGSIKSIGLSTYDIRDQWIKNGWHRGLPARVWKATLADIVGNIHACQEAAKVKVVRSIFKRTESIKDKENRTLRIIDYAMRLKRIHGVTTSIYGAKCVSIIDGDIRM